MATPIVLNNDTAPAFVVFPDGSEEGEECILDAGQVFRFRGKRCEVDFKDNLKKLVGGRFEMVTVKNLCVRAADILPTAYDNEMGRDLDLAFNSVATQMVGSGHILFGPVVFVRNKAAMRRRLPAVRKSPRQAVARK